MTMTTINEYAKQLKAYQYVKRLNIQIAGWLFEERYFGQFQKVKEYLNGIEQGKDAQELMLDLGLAFRSVDGIVYSPLGLILKTNGVYEKFQDFYVSSETFYIEKGNFLHYLEHGEYTKGGSFEKVPLIDYFRNKFEQLGLEDYSIQVFQLFGRSLALCKIEERKLNELKDRLIQFVNRNSEKCEEYRGTMESLMYDKFNINDNEEPLAVGVSRHRSN